MFCSFLFGLFVAPTEAATPKDIAFLKNVIHASKRQPVSEIKKQFVQMSLKQVDDISKQRGYPSWFRAKNTQIKKQIERLIDADLGSSPSMKQLSKFGMLAVSGYYAEQGMAAAARAPKISIPKQSASKSLAHSATMRKNGSRLRLQVDASKVSNDQGFIGTGNGLLEQGESATVSL